MPCSTDMKLTKSQTSPASVARSQILSDDDMCIFLDTILVQKPSFSRSESNLLITMVSCHFCPHFFIFQEFLIHSFLVFPNILLTSYISYIFAHIYTSLFNRWRRYRVWPRDLRLQDHAGLRGQVRQAHKLARLLRRALHRRYRHPLIQIW